MGVAAAVSAKGTRRTVGRAALEDPCRPTHDTRAAKAVDGTLCTSVPTSNGVGPSYPRVPNLIVDGKAGKEEAGVLAANTRAINLPAASRLTDRSWLVASTLLTP